MANRPPGQSDALADLCALEADSASAIEVVPVADSDDVDEAMLVDLSIDCRGFVQAGKGLKLRNRERFWLYFHEDFPLSPPSIFAHDTRFAFSDHVYWMGKLGVYLCVYYSVEHQWQPEQGVLGFVHAFIHWLESAAAGTLDAAAQPQHPPQHAGDRAKQFFVACADTPDFDGAWLGYAVVESKSGDRFDIVDWTKDCAEHKHHTLAPAILIDTPFVSEFPKHVSSLLLFFDKLGIDSELLATVPAMNLFAVSTASLRRTKRGGNAPPTKSASLARGTVTQLAPHCRASWISVRWRPFCSNQDHPDIAYY